MIRSVIEITLRLFHLYSQEHPPFKNHDLRHTECNTHLVHMLNICPIFIIQSIVHRLSAIK